MRPVMLRSVIPHNRPPGGRNALTLIELLAVISIIALLMGILAPALVWTRNETKSFVCMDHMRAAAFSFRLFADPYTCPDRGDSARLFAPRFSAMDFQESLYQTCEFWSSGSLPRNSEVYRRGRRPIICPAGPVGLARYHGHAASSLTQGGVAPREKVSYGMNRRLIWAPATVSDPPVPVDCFVTIGTRILDHPRVPLMFDVDAKAAVKVHKEPFFAAPPSHRSEPSVYDNNRYWFPSMRHSGKMSAGFVGGHVISTRNPLSDPSWDWEYHPEISGRP